MLNKDNLAVKYLKEALKSYQALNFEPGIYISFLMLSSFEQDRGREKEAEKYFKKAREIITRAARNPKQINMINIFLQKYIILGQNIPDAEDKIEFKNN